MVSTSFILFSFLSVGAAEFGHDDSIGRNHQRQQQYQHPTTTQLFHQQLVSVAEDYLVVRHDRNLQLVDVGDALCIQATAVLIGMNEPGGFAAAFGLDGVNCNTQAICDFEGTTYAEEAATNCAAAGGRLLTSQTVAICQEDINDETIDGDIILTNIPVCLASSCSPDTTYPDLLKTLYDISVLNGSSTDVAGFENTFEGRCTPTEIQWFVTSYDDRTASVGDTVIFFYGPRHNVNIHPTGTCSTTGNIVVGSSIGPAAYTFQENEANTNVTFACNVGLHCEQGQIITFSVRESIPSSAPSSLAPSTSSAPSPSSAPSSVAPVSSAPTTAPPSFSESPGPTFRRKTPKGNDKESLKLLPKNRPPTALKGIRGGGRQLSHFSPMEKRSQFLEAESTS